MLRRVYVRVLICTATIVLAVTGGLQVASASAQPAATAAGPAGGGVGVQQVTLHYDVSRAGEFKDAVATAAAVWNSSVQNVRLEPVPAGERAEIRVVADDGWPRAQLGPVRPGQTVTWWFGRQAVNEGYDLVRIAAHETGHSLGLPDRKPGPCSSLMSGSTGGVDCKNASPNASERAAVEAAYAHGAASVPPADGRILVDRP